MLNKAFLLCLVIVISAESNVMISESVKAYNACEKMGSYSNTTKYPGVKEFIEELKTKVSTSKELADMLIDLYFNKAKWNIQELLIALPTGFYFFLFTLIFSIITLITWIFFWFCCCCNCCLFKSKQRGSRCKRLVFAIITAGFLGSAAFIGIFSLANKKEFRESFNGIVCYSGKFFNETLNGEDIKEGPKWIGLNNFGEFVEKTVKKISTTIEEYKPKVNMTELKELKEKTAQYTDNVVKNSTEFSKKVDTFFPGVPTIYNTEFSNSKDSNTIISHINEESFRIAVAIELMEQLQKNLTNVDVNEFVAGFEKMNESISSVAKEVVKIKQNYDKYANEYPEKINKFIPLAFQILFGPLVILCVISLVIVIIFVLTKLTALKFFLHLLWNILLLFLIFTFIVGSFFGLTSGIVNQGITMIDNIFLTDLIFKGTEKKLIETCLEGDGSIAKAINITGQVSKVDALYNSTKDFANFIKSIPTENSTVYEDAFKKIEIYKDDYSESTNVTYKDKDIAYVLDGINKVTDLNKSGKCQTQIRYVPIQKKCPEGYEYAGSQEMTVGNKYCALIQDRNIGIDINAVYVNCSEKEKNEIYQSFTKLKDFYEAHVKKIETIDNGLELLNNENKELIVKLKDPIKKTEEITNATLELFDSITQGTLLDNAYNCSYIKRNLISFLDILANHFTKVSTVIGICCIVTSFLAYFGVYFMLKAIYMTKKKRASSKSLDGKDYESLV